jgi:hypothetical protein
VNSEERGSKSPKAAKIALILFKKFSPLFADSSEERGYISGTKFPQTVFAVWGG